MLEAKPNADELSPPLECCVLTPAWTKPLVNFFLVLSEGGDGVWFHPHPLTAQEAETRAKYSGGDLYYILVEGRTILAYGMLRGWDEGYKVPSLGIVVHPSVRGTGLGRAFMHFLHAAARRRGAKQVRLKVHAGNVAARELYIDLGYHFQDAYSEELIGVFDLA